VTVEAERIPEVTEKEPALEAKLHEMWESKPGLRGWLSTTDHKEIGILYLVTAFVFLVAGGIQALIMRLQLAGPDNHIVNPAVYNELFSMHGNTMIFWYAFPVLSGFSNYFWPLLLGSRDMAFPRLNAFSYWVFLASGIFLYCSFAAGSAPNAGWFSYPPYTSREFNPGAAIDFYTLGLIFFGISLTAGGINFIVTTLRTRCPGMSINRFPVVIWGTLSANAAGMLVVPTVSVACFFLWMDRNFGTHFFNAADGGQPLLWQHLFWMFAHPWVYMIVLPAMGIVSDALPVFCRRPLVGYTAVVLSTVLTSVQPQYGPWPPSGPPSFLYAAPQSAVMLLGSAGLWWADRSAARGERLMVLLGLLASLILALGFIALQFLDWGAKPYSLATDAYSSLYFVITGVHLTMSSPAP
jgi:cytochrome c oxidase subunit 1/cytochrome c oxidase subunit I+III